MRLAFAVKAVLILGIIATPLCAIGQTFEYFGDHGPSFWGQLSPEWAVCSTGEIQSPVNFGPARRFQKLPIHYTESTGEIFNNGHTVEVEVDHGNILTLQGIDYELHQFHFHVPSEHKLNGRGFDMELHLVHKSEDGATAVIGIFLKRGRSSGEMASIFQELPDDIDVHHPLSESFHPAEFLPKSRSHYRYLGSLTTPPCSEGVQWILLKDAVTVSDEDIAQFAERIHFNARLVQRKIK
jgi:carbonic anhydrase